MPGNHGCSIARRVFTSLTYPLARAGITLNQVTVTGALLSVGIAVSTLPFGYVWQGALVLALVSFTDSADGTLVRMTSGGTRFGAFLGLTSDHIVDGAVFTSLTVWTVLSSPEGLPRTLATGFGLAAIISTGVVPYARARAESIGVEAGLGIAERIDRLLIVILNVVFTDFGWGVRWLVTGLGWVAFASFVTVIQRVISVAKTVREETWAWHGGMTSRPGEDE